MEPRLDPIDPAADADSLLLLRSASGDLGAFDALVERNRGWILNLVYRYVGDAHEAEDIAQEVFVRLFLARNKYVSEAPFRSFVYKTAVNLCLNEVRRRRRRPADVGMETIPEPASVLGDPQSETARGELAEQVLQALQQLPDAQRMAVVLSRYNELSYREIAEAMDCSVKAVEALLHRAKRSLARQLGEYVGPGPQQPPM